MYYVSHEGQQMGPWPTDEIMKQLKTHALGWSDYIYDEAKEDWIFIMDHAEFKAHYQTEVPPVKETASPSTPPPQGSTQPGDKEWFVLKAENRYGPFSYVELVRMLQEKNLYEFDYVWNPSMTAWARVAEVEEFKPEKIRGLKESTCRRFSSAVVMRVRTTALRSSCTITKRCGRAKRSRSAPAARV